MKLRIADRLVGDEEQCFIIAEAGVNHNGDVDLAKRLVKAARDAGADAVKFQTWITEEVMVRTLEKPEYQKQRMSGQETQFDMAKKLQLTFDETRELADYAKGIGIVFLSTPEGKRCTDLLQELNVPVFKIGSSDMNNYPHLRYVAKKSKPIILSTGMATMRQVEDSVNVIRNSGNHQIVLLHCTTSYPTALPEVNLNAMITMRKLGLPVGYSDHTQGLAVSLVAASLGACVLEKHFTLDRALLGPDHRASLEPLELKEMVDRIHSGRSQLEVEDELLQTIMGDGEKKPAKSEIQIERFVRKYIVADVDIERGTVIEEEMLGVKRTGGRGLNPVQFYDVVGKSARQHIGKDEPLEWEMLE